MYLAGISSGRSLQGSGTATEWSDEDPADDGELRTATPGPRRGSSGSPPSSRTPTRCGRGPSRRRGLLRQNWKQGVRLQEDESRPGQKAEMRGSGSFLPSSRSPMADGGALGFRTRASGPNWAELLLLRVLLRGRGELVRASRAAMGAFYRARSSV